MAMRDAQLAEKGKLLELTSKQLDVLDKFHDRAIGKIEPIVQSTKLSPAEKQSKWADAVSSAETEGWLKPNEISKNYPGDDEAQLMLTSLKRGQQQIADAKEQAQTREASNKADQDAAETANLQAQLPKLQAESAVAPQLAQLSVSQKKADISKTRADTAKTQAETANLGQLPVFGVDPTTNERVMTTRPEAAAKGYTNLVPVKEGDVSKETDARAMINDVQLNKSRYAAAMAQVYQQPMSGKQMTALTALTPEKLGIDLGGFNLSLPDVVQKVSNATAFSVLSPAQKQAVVGYYSTLASVPAAQKALTNTGRANKEMLDLELRTIPTPIMDSETFNLALDRFQGNIDQTARKTVRLPGMPSTQDIRRQYEPETPPPVDFNLPRPMTKQPLSSLLGQQQ
jgi:hypothetical protein